MCVVTIRSSENVLQDRMRSYCLNSQSNCILSAKLVFEANDLEEIMYAECFRVGIAGEIIDIASKKLCFS